MHISRLIIRNFRNFKSAIFRFQKGVNTLISENASGKTNAFHAIRLLLDDSLPRNAVQFRESDFNRILQDWRGHWIIISIEFEELDTSEGCQILRHNTGHMSCEQRGTYTLFFRPKRETRKALYLLSSQQNSDSQEIIQCLRSITINDYEYIFTGRASSDFFNDEVYKQLVGDFEKMSFPDPSQDDSRQIGVIVQPIHKEVTCTFIKALRDVITDLRTYRDNPLLGLLRGTENKINLVDADRITEQVKRLNSDISSLSEIQEISSGIQDTLRTTVGNTYSPNIGIESELPSDMEKLLQRLSLKVGDSDEYRGDMSELSLGGANIIYLSLKMLEYELKLSTDRVAHFLLIEEPEAHIHTHVQMTLFDKYKYHQTQVFVSTHSTHLSAASKIRSVNILAKTGNQAQVFHPSNNLDKKTITHLERYMDAIRTTLLFAKGIIMVEGDAETILIPHLVKQVFGISLDEIGVSLINTSNTAFTNVAVLFHEHRIRRRCAIITDLDASIIDLVADPNEDEATKKFRIKSKNSEEAGRERKLELEKFCKGNEWLKPFYAMHTFEVDFLLSENQEVLIKCLPEIYSQTARQETSQELLRNSDKSISGREVLRLAESEGKGWFAILITDCLTTNTQIPDYILSAIGFASKDTINASHYKVIAQYRLRSISSNEQIEELKMADEQQESKFLEKYIELFPNDQLTKLIKEVEVK